jgi:UTP--glucose-1-phosphate uridylyltransferase
MTAARGMHENMSMTMGTSSPCTVAVIPAAGRGTRMRPATNAVPKAMLPIVDRPAVQYVVEEAARAGATTIAIVVDPELGHLITRHFAQCDPIPLLESVDIVTVTQPEPLGLGDAILTAADVVGNRSFMCLLADTLTRPDADLLGPLLAAFDGTSVVALNRVSPEDQARYGIAAVGAEITPGVYPLTAAVEKPGAAHAPSDLGLIGRYVFTPDVFEVLRDLEPGHGDEIQLTDAINALATAGRSHGVVVEDHLLDMGRPIGFLEACMVIGLADDTLRVELATIIDRERGILQAARKTA